MAAYHGEFLFSVQFIYDIQLPTILPEIEIISNFLGKSYLSTSPSDIETLSKWILNQPIPLDPRITKIVYKLLNLLGFQSNDAIGIQQLVHLCFDTLIHVHDNPSSTPGSNESLHQVILLMRICSNIVALENSFGGYIIDHWFCSQNRSMASFFNHFIEQFSSNGLSVEEIYWFTGNLMKCQINESSTKFVEYDEFFVKLNMNSLNE